MALPLRSNSGDGFGISGAARGIGTSLVFGVAAALVLGTIHYFAALSQGVLDALLLAAGGGSALAGGYAAARGASARGWMHGAASGALYALTLWVAQSVGLVSAQGLTWLACLAALGICTLAGGLGGMVAMAIAP